MIITYIVFAQLFMMGVFWDENIFYKILITVFAPVYFPIYLGINFQYFFDNIKPISDKDRPYKKQKSHDFYSDALDGYQPIDKLYTHNPPKQTMD